MRRDLEHGYIEPPGELEGRVRLNCRIRGASARDGKKALGAQCLARHDRKKAGVHAT
jgi:hypothetical protein